MANKERSIGCKIFTNEYNWDEFRISESDSLAVKEWTFYRTVGCGCCSQSITIKEIIGHPVMLWTIFERYSASKWFINSQFITKLVDKWTGYDRSIEDQSDECIDFVYSLIQK